MDNNKEKTEAAEKLDMMRHSTAHVMAEAVQSMFPDAKFGIGPTIEDGFYYDFELPRALSPDDLPVIEAKMKEIVKANVRFHQNNGKLKKKPVKFSLTSLINWS